VPVEEDAQTASGYAKEVSEEYKQKQAALLEAALGRCDACVTTALIPGRPAPTLDHREDGGGDARRDRCSSTSPPSRAATARSPARRADRQPNGVTIVGDADLPSHMATPREPDVLAQHGEAARH
jgi:NAD(P) transhydrogenase subunit alpha